MNESGTCVSVRNLDEVRRYLDELPDDLFDEAKTVFSKAVLSADRKIKENATNALHVRSGALRRSINTDVSGSNLGTLRASVFSAAVVGGKEVVYTPIHEFGGTVRAIDKYLRVPGGPYLNIPTSANKTPAGVTRLQAREVFNQGGYIAKTQSGKWGVFLGGQMMFTLKKQVTIPARLGMVRAAEGEIPTILSGLANLIGG